MTTETRKPRRRPVAPVIADDRDAYDAYNAACQAAIAKCSQAIDEARANCKTIEDAAWAARDQEITAAGAELDKRRAEAGASA